MAGSYAIGPVHLPTAMGVAALMLFLLSFSAEDRWTKSLSRITALMLAVLALIPFIYAIAIWPITLYLAVTQPHMLYEILGLNALNLDSFAISSAVGAVLALASFRAINTVSEQLNKATYITI